MLRGGHSCPLGEGKEHGVDSGMYVYLGGDTVLLKFAKESGLGDAKLLSGLGDVVAKPGKRFDDGRPFQLS